MTSGSVPCGSLIQSDLNPQSSFNMVDHKVNSVNHEYEKAIATATALNEETQLQHSKPNLNININIDSDNEQSPYITNDNINNEKYVHPFQLYKVNTNSKSIQFFGPTSFLQISPTLYNSKAKAIISNKSLDEIANIPKDLISNSTDNNNNNSININNFINENLEIIKNLISFLFTCQYPNTLFIYREYFLRDFELGNGPYYTPGLLCALCSYCCLFFPNDLKIRNLGPKFYSLSENWIFESLRLLNDPSLTLIQSILFLSLREYMVGEVSKAWSFTGLSFRLVFEMGLHLDPDNWDNSKKSRIERELRRRVYWGNFIIDKFMSFCYGRPSFLNIFDSDVRITVRLPYPGELRSSVYDSLTTNEANMFKLLSRGENRMCLVNSWVYMAELSKILDKMLRKVFGNDTNNINYNNYNDNENENGNENSQKSDLNFHLICNSIGEIHIELEKWLFNLPYNLHWNQWININESSSTPPTSSDLNANDNNGTDYNNIEPIVLILHMTYHSILITLYRPILLTGLKNIVNNFKFTSNKNSSSISLSPIASQLLCNDGDDDDDDDDNNSDNIPQNKKNNGTSIEKNSLDYAFDTCWKSMKIIIDLLRIFNKNNTKFSPIATTDANTNNSPRFSFNIFPFHMVNVISTAINLLLTHLTMDLNRSYHYSIAKSKETNTIDKNLNQNFNKLKLYSNTIKYTTLICFKHLKTITKSIENMKLSCPIITIVERLLINELETIRETTKHLKKNIILNNNHNHKTNGNQNLNDNNMSNPFYILQNNISYYDANYTDFKNQYSHLFRNTNINNTNANNVSNSTQKHTEVKSAHISVHTNKKQSQETISDTNVELGNVKQTNIEVDSYNKTSQPIVEQSQERSTKRIKLTTDQSTTRKILQISLQAPELSQAYNISDHHESLSFQTPQILKFQPPSPYLLEDINTTKQQLHPFEYFDNQIHSPTIQQQSQQQSQEQTTTLTAANSIIQPMPNNREFDTQLHNNYSDALSDLNESNMNQFDYNCEAEPFPFITFENFMFDDDTSEWDSFYRQFHLNS